MGKLTISMAIFNSYFDITRGYFDWAIGRRSLDMAPWSRQDKTSGRFDTSQTTTCGSCAIQEKWPWAISTDKESMGYSLFHGLSTNLRSHYIILYPLISMIIFHVVMVFNHPINISHPRNCMIRGPPSWLSLSSTFPAVVRKSQGNSWNSEG